MAQQPEQLDQAVADCLLQALTDVEIADATGASVAHVRLAVQRLCDRYEARNRVALALQLQRLVRG